MIRFSLSFLDPSLAQTRIQLVDSVAGVVRELSPGIEYSLNLNSGEHIGRFYLKFAGAVTGISRQQVDPGVFEAVCSGGILRLNIGRLDGPSGMVRLYDLSGRLLREQTVTEAGYHEMRAEQATGIYILSYTSGDIAVSRKITTVIR
jgi:hypothetical protein